MSEGRAATGYDHGYDAQKFYLGLASTRVRLLGFVEGCSERTDEDEPDEEEFLRGVWKDGDDREFVLETPKSGVEIGPGRPPG